MENFIFNTKERYSIFPIQYNDIYQFYKKCQECYWISEEVDLSDDNFNNLTKDEQHFIKYVLAFFAGSDGIVNENLAVNFYNTIDIPEVRCVYSFQILIETIHSEMYSLLIDKYIKSETEKEYLFDAIHTIPCIEKKAKWAKHYISNGNIIEKLIAFAAVEGIFFSGSFCAIYWLKSKKCMPGLTHSNELISRDEGLHTEFACLLYNYYTKNKLTDKHIYTIITEAVDIEKEFITDALPVSLLGMNNNDMSKYIEFVADRLLIQLGMNKYYHTENPFDFMNMISLPRKTNFFEGKVSEYKYNNKTNFTIDDSIDF
jgi:ribonucleoside-diphosphate reductase beta chain